jgi:hypothetical protein
MFNGVSTSGTSVLQVQIGSGSVTTTGYSSASSIIQATVITVALTTGFAIRQSLATETSSGVMTLSNFSGNTWAANGVLGGTNSVSTYTCGGISPALSGALDRVRITTVNGTDTFDAGSINIMYEG